LLRAAVVAEAQQITLVKAAAALAGIALQLVFQYLLQQQLQLP
jgi:hypothetical protein